MRSKMLVLALSASSALSIAACNKTETRPSRAQCLVEANVFPDASGRIAEEKLLLLMPAAHGEGIPLGGYGVRSSRIYLQYAGRCGERIVMSSRLLSEAGFTLSKPLTLHPVTPGPDTVDISGAAWRD